MTAAPSDDAATLDAALSEGALAVISDIHANVHALRAALGALDGADLVIVMGDLLTYGCEPLAVLDELDRLADRLPVVFVKGNHDQLYFDLAAGTDLTYFDALPDFVRESVEWTARQIDSHALETRYAWRERLTLGPPVLFAHANPFPYGDWTYLNSEAELRRAATALRADGWRVGVFGHTHRRRAVTVTGSGVGTLLADVVSPRGDEVAILNPGSVGQPRGAGSSLLRLRAAPDARGAPDAPDALRLDFHDLRYDVGAHLDAIIRADLSDATKARLARFFEGSAP